MISLTLFQWILLYLAIALFHFNGIIKDGRNQEEPIYLSDWETKFLLTNIGLSLIFWIDYLDRFVLPITLKLIDEIKKERKFKGSKQKIKRKKIE